MKNFENFEEVKQQRGRLHGSKVCLSSNGAITLGADFIDENDLKNKEAVTLLKLPGDSLILGLKFEDKYINGSYKLRCDNRKNSTCLTRTLVASQYISSCLNLTAISKDPNRENRIFDIKHYKENIFFIEFRPSFEFSMPFSDIRNIPSDLVGIYRCLDKNEQVVYIGSGNVRERALSKQREYGTQFKYLEYSEIKDRDEAFKWEDYFLSKYQSKHGVKPTFNLINAPQKVSKINGESA